MAEHTSIEWTDHTFNPWWGCQKVSPGCTNCYAETLSNRFGKNIWGPPHATDRRTFGDSHWAEPAKWNRAAESAGVRARVFCASMADVFEEAPQVADARARLFDLIEATPWLDWQLLTKRPQNVLDMVPIGWAGDWFPANVWIGTSVEDQARADERIPKLLEIPASVRFLSCEPLLGPVDLAPWIRPCTCPDREMPIEDQVPFHHGGCDRGTDLGWVIVGGESGPGARPMHPDWATSLRDQCVSAGVPFLFKQWGEHRPLQPGDRFPDPRISMIDRGTDWPGPRAVIKVGKRSAGRVLDGRTWDEMPEAVTADG